MPNPFQNRLELQLSMLCRRCGRKILLMSEKQEAQMNGGLCRDCCPPEKRRFKGLTEEQKRLFQEVLERTRKENERGHGIMNRKKFDETVARLCALGVLDRGDLILVHNPGLKRKAEECIATVEVGVADLGDRHECNLGLPYCAPSEYRLHVCTVSPAPPYNSSR